MTRANDVPRAQGSRGLLERALSIFATTQAGEGATALLLTTNVFLLLTSYYLLKTAREPLILEGGAELKSYSSAGQALLLIPTTYLYGKLTERVGRMQLITVVTLLFTSNIFVFLGLHALHVPVGVPFFLWVGVFSLMIVAQFWSFAADIYTEAQGKRLFAILGIGGTLGAVAGSAFARWLIHPIGVYGLMLTAAAFLLASLAVTHVVHWRERRAQAGAAAEDHARHGSQPALDAADAPLGKEGGFALLLSDRYLLLIAALAFLLNCANTNGEYILDRTLLAHVQNVIPAGADPQAFKAEYVGGFKASYFLYVNSATVVLQLFAVSRLIKYLGVRVALFIAPLISLTGYSLMLFWPVLGLIFAVKICENTLDYSLQNTARQALWLLTSRDEKYKAKSVIDAFIVRCGDLLSAGITAIGAALQFSVVHFVLVNLLLVAGWVTAIVLLTREHRRREKAGDEQVKRAPARDAQPAAA